MSSSGVRGILFDFDDTLVKTTKSDISAIEKVKERLRRSLCMKHVELIVNEYLEKLAFHSIDPKGIIDPHKWRTELWQQAINLVPISCTKPNAHDIYHLWRFSRLEGISLDQEVIRTLSQLRLRYKLAIITNADPVIQREKLQTCGIREYVDAIIISGEQLYPKPHPSIFHTACSSLGVLPEECIMVGDDLMSDVQGGINAGMKATVWVKNESQQKCTSAGYPTPDFTIDALKELPSVLSQISS
ncbi:N-acylneuraminate-9-phosphatase-like [Actinia tenebrosa]|uniref:N-acylneuraminate-9-phosphatase-like n=1 Tax=Actinia tenebrosa TaxID=6105 RepID=A0A6P8IVF1_ACTTE|nr:N-acylneuraminate-9-phosphatase-like [Actinia tenebrosa]